MPCSRHLAVHSLLLIFHSSLSPIRAFSNCTTIPSQGLSILFLLPVMGSSLPAGQWVIQLQNPFEKLLCRIISSINCCRSGSRKQTPRPWYFLQYVYLSMFSRSMPLREQWLQNWAEGENELQCSCNISFSQYYEELLNYPFSDFLILEEEPVFCKSTSTNC